MIRIMEVLEVQNVHFCGLPSLNTSDPEVQSLCTRPSMLLSDPNLSELHDEVIST